MRIELNGTMVELGPETDTERQKLGELWDLLVDCAKFNRKLVPVGEFVPADPVRSRQARFDIED